MHHNTKVAAKYLIRVQRWQFCVAFHNAHLRIGAHSCGAAMAFFHWNSSGRRQWALHLDARGCGMVWSTDARGELLAYLSGQALFFGASIAAANFNGPVHENVVKIKRVSVKFPAKTNHA